MLLLKHLKTVCALLCMCIAVGQAYGQQRDPSLLKQQLTAQIADSQKLTAYRQLVKHYNSKSSDSATFYAQEGLAYFRKQHYGRGQAWMLFLLGDLDDTHGSSVLAETKLEYALKLFKENGDKEGLAVTLATLGVVEGKKGKYDRAFLKFADAEKLYVAMGDRNGLLRCWINVALLYDRCENAPKTLEFLKRADSLSKMLPVSEHVIRLNNNLAAYLYEHGDTEAATRYYDKCMELSNKPEFMQMRIIGMMNMGLLKYQTGNEAVGRKLLMEALDLTRSYNYPDQETTILINCAILFKNDDTAKKFLDRAFALTQLTGNKTKEIRIYDQYQALHGRQNNYKLANEYLKKVILMSDSMLKANKASELTGLQALYDLEQSTVKVQGLEELLGRLKMQKNVIALIAALVLTLLFIVLVYYRKTKMLNRSLETRKQELDDLNRMKDKIFSVIGHDLRGPVSNIPAILEIIEDEVNIPDEHKEILMALKDQTNATIETLDKLMLLGSAQFKGKHYTPERFNPKKYLSSGIELKLFAMSKKNIKVVDNTSDDLDIVADQGHFEFIMRNLLSNAIKFSRAGGRVDINADEQAQPGMVVFSVKDEGVGMTPEVMQHVFKSTVTSTYGTENEKGNGIGLMLCEEFVRLNGGKIWVESEQGKGSTFYFSLRSGK